MAATTTLLIASMVATAASAAMTAMNQRAAGKAAQDAAQARASMLERQADLARQNAGQERAAAQRTGNDKRRIGELLSSRALAVSAASGAGAGDPTVENILGEVGAEGEFRALTELFVGEARARSLEGQADTLVFGAGQERRAGEIARELANRTAFTTIIGGAGDVAGTAYTGGLFNPSGPDIGSLGQGLSRYGYPTVYTPGLKKRFG